MCSAAKQYIPFKVDEEKDVKPTNQLYLELMSGIIQLDLHSSIRLHDSVLN
jgi:hypothetical protein